MSNKIPPFLISRSRVKDRDFIIYTKEPQLICEVFICHTPEEEMKIRETYTTITKTEFKGIRALIVVIEVWRKAQSQEEVEKPLKRMAEWYNGILQDKVKNNEL